jgi:hypothetical protein
MASFCANAATAPRTSFLTLFLYPARSGCIATAHSALVNGMVIGVSVAQIAIGEGGRPASDAGRRYAK